MNPIIVRLVFALVLSIIPVGFLFADGNSPTNREEWLAKEKNEPALLEGSDASFDKRLPPAYPGEELKDGDKTIKLWSTTGPVPVADAPEPWRKRYKRGEYDSPEEIGVIIDKRRDVPVKDQK